jgi:16S rRNA processing protein RimM
MHGDQLVLKLSAVDDRTTAETLKGMEIRIPLDERPPAPDGEYYLSDLAGCRMESVDGRVIGEVEGYLDFGAAPLLQVRQGERELLVPFAEGIYRKVDLENRLIVVDLPEGLEEL